MRPSIRAIIFNLLGPLANPADAPYQLLGVGKPELLDPLAGAVARLGTRQAVLVCSRDGLDEVSLAAPTRVRIVRGNEFESREWLPAEFGLGAVTANEIRAESPAASAAIIRAVLTGRFTGSRMTLANAGRAGPPRPFHVEGRRRQAKPRFQWLGHANLEHHGQGLKNRGRAAAAKRLTGGFHEH